jgi:hypothetical protein
VGAVLILVQEVTETALSQKRLAFLSEASAVLASWLEYETTLANVARVATHTLADWSTVEMLEDSQWVSRVAAAHQDPIEEKRAQQLPQRYCLDRQAKIGVPQVLRTGKPEIYPNFKSEPTLGRSQARRWILSDIVAIASCRPDGAGTGAPPLQKRAFLLSHLPLVPSLRLGTPL